MISAEQIRASREPVDPLRIAAATHARWRVFTVGSTGSTNDDLSAAARAGSTGRRALLAEMQVTGRGRRGRTWTAPAGAGLTISMLLDLPAVPLARRSWISPLGGVALLGAVAEVTGVVPPRSGLKWPNDLLIDGRKCAGILAEATSSGAVLGIGLNVSQRPDELPRADAGSLMLSGANSIDREALAVRLLDRVWADVERWQQAKGDPAASGLLADFREFCITLGRRVRVELPGDEVVVGVAVDIADDGSLVVKTSSGPRSFAAADVHHLRSEPDAGPSASAG